MEAGPARDAKDALVILGMHRSGTSAMARVLSLAGARLPTSMMPPGHGNAVGHWEPQEVADFNDRIFADLDSGWHDPFGPRGVRSRKFPTQRYLAEARDILRRNYEGGDLIVLKEPRLSIFFDLWAQALQQEAFKLHFIIMVRHPSEVAASLKERDGFVQNKSLILWTTHMLASEVNTRDFNRIFVSYDDLLTNPEMVLDRIEAQLALTLPRRTWDSLLETQEFLRRDLKHHDVKASLPKLTGFAEVERLYNYLEAASRGEPWNADISVEAETWLDGLETTVGPMLKQTERQLRAAESQAHAEREQAAVARAALEAGHLEVQSAQAALTEARDRAAHLEAELAAARNQIVTREAEFSQDRARAEADAQAARHHAAQLEGELAAARDHIAAREAEFSQDRARAEADAQAARHHAAQLEAELREDVARAEADAQAARDHAAQLEGELAAARDHIAAREAEFGADRARAEADAQAARDRASKRETEFSAHLARAEADANAASEQSAQLAAELNDAKDVISRGARTLAERLEHADAESKAERDHVLSLEANLAQLLTRTDQEISALASQLESAEGEARAAREEANKLRSAMAARDIELTQRTNELRGNADQARARADELDTRYQSAMSALKAKDAELNDQRARADVELRSARDQAAALARALADSVVERNHPAGLWAVVRRLGRSMLMR